MITVLWLQAALEGGIMAMLHHPARASVERVYDSFAKKYAPLQAY
jgi:hypothetical protein